MINKTRGICISIFTVALLLRIGLNVVKTELFFREPFFLSGDAYSKSINSDSVWYDAAARAFIQGKGIVSIEENIYRRNFYREFTQPAWLLIKKIAPGYYAHKLIPPLYPIFLSLCYLLFGMNTLSYFIPQAIVGSLTCVVIYFLAEELFDKKTAILAGFATALYPDLILWTYFIRVETLFIFLLSLSFLFLAKAGRTKSVFMVSAGAIIFGLACLTRITAILFIPILFLWQLYNFNWNKKSGFKVSLAATLLTLLILTPWCARNYIVFGEFTPFTDEVNVAIIGVRADAYRVPGSNAYYGRDADRFTDSEAYYRSHKSSIVGVLMYVKDHLKENSLSYVKNFMTFLGPCTVHMKNSAKIYKTLVWIIIFPLAFWGMVVSLKSKPGSGLLILFIIYYALLHSLAGVDTGLVYRYPIQPFLCIFAAYGALELYKRRKGWII